MMRNISELCKKIGIPDEVAGILVEFDAGFHYETVKDAMDKLFYRDTWDEGQRELQAYLGEDPDRLKMLSCMLRCGLRTYEYYVQHGISEEIYVDTMKCFVRFMEEHKAGYGRYAFDREWWTARQIAGQLFRIGELEYEMCFENGSKCIQLHIPSDAILAKEKLSDSLSRAKDFFIEKFPDYSLVDWKCHSWLLSPTLKELLNPSSKILGFQKLFEIKIVGEKLEKEEFMTWVYKRPDLAYEDLPEDTSLQRNLKEYLKKGGQMADAEGVLRDFG